MLKARGLGVVGILMAFGVLGTGPAGAQSVSVSPITLTDHNIVNLTTLGPDGWTEWWSNDPNSGNFVSTTGQIFTTTTFPASGFVNVLDIGIDHNHTVAFTWTNGNDSNNTFNTGMLEHYPLSYLQDTAGSGFAISVPTVGPSGTVQFFVSNWDADASLNAQLKNGSGTVLGSMTDTSFDNGRGYTTGYYTVNYSGAATGDTLLLNYTVAVDHGLGVPGGGWVGIQAAALQGSSPVPDPAAATALALVLPAGLMRPRPVAR